MKNQKQNLFETVCLIAGVVLMVAALVLLLLWQVGIRTFAEQAASRVHTLRTLIPEPRGAVPEPRRDNTMPALSLEGTDFIGILEMPKFGASLPVGADWKNPVRYPCRFQGSIYDGSIQIGATSQKGQYDFYREISPGDMLYFTDMTGNRYTYTVTNIRYVNHADGDTLNCEEASLVLFIKNVYAFEYILISCEIPE